MPNWNEVLAEINQQKAAVSAFSPLDAVRRKYLKELSDYTKRPLIAYYSGWLSRSPNIPNMSITDADKNAFMSVIHGSEKKKGLDLILHTPGGSLAAAESLVDYLRRVFGHDIRAIVPQLAMSAGTMIACSCSRIVMGKESNLGPIDPQLNGMPCNGVIAEFERAIQEIKTDPNRLPAWQMIIGKYHPTFLGECRNAIEWSEKVVEEWLRTCMFKGDKQGARKARRIVKELSDTNKNKSHSRHIHIDACEKMGLEILRLESDDKLQDLALTVHHAYMQTFAEAQSVVKIVENERGIGMVLHHGQPVVIGR
jgi:Serine dehydrogenase proteinase